MGINWKGNSTRLQLGPTGLALKSKMAIVLCLLFLIQSGLGLPVEESEVPYVTPEHLDSLLASKQYDEFSRLVRIKDVNRVRPSANSRNPTFNEYLRFGDILDRPDSFEEGRQGIRFDKHPQLKWPNGVVPFAISDKYSAKDLATIKAGIDTWNKEIECIKLSPVSSFDSPPKDYVMIYPGDGCTSHIGRLGGQQTISLSTHGCLDQGTIFHEIGHAIGLDHEQNRYDRDRHIDILWWNIPINYWSQYYKAEDMVKFGVQGRYDPYSVMHYFTDAPGTGRRAIRFRFQHPTEYKVGRATDLSDIDKQKISRLYC